MSWQLWSEVCIHKTSARIQGSTIEIFFFQNKNPQSAILVCYVLTLKKWFLLNFNTLGIFNLHSESARETGIDEYEVNKRVWLAGMHRPDKELMIPGNMALLPLRF